MCCTSLQASSCTQTKSTAFFSEIEFLFMPCDYRYILTCYFHCSYILVKRKKKKKRLGKEKKTSVALFLYKFISYAKCYTALGKVTPEDLCVIMSMCYAYTNTCTEPGEPMVIKRQRTDVTFTQQNKHGSKISHHGIIRSTFTQEWL